MASTQSIALDIGRRRLRAVLASTQRHSVRVSRVLVEDVPEGLDPEDVNAVGKWVGQSLKAAGFPKGDATFALARAHVVLKRIMLPSTDDRELPHMTRLALQRELPFDADQAVIDYVPVERGETSTTVLAVAVPEEVLDHTRRVAQAAGLGIERVSLRAMGTAALLRSLGADPDETVLAVDVIGESVEFCIVSAGVVRFSRAADISNLTEVSAIADSVITETRRTWMSYRIVEESPAVGGAVVVGDRLVSEQTARPIGKMLSVKAEILDSHPMIDGANHNLDRLWPLAGLLLETALGQETINFASPRKRPDTAGQTRRRTLLAAGAVVVMLGTLWTIGRIQLQKLQDELDRLKGVRGDLIDEDYRCQRDGAKLEHLVQWEAARVDWLSHVQFLSDLLPPADTVVLDSWTGSLEFRGVRYDKDAQQDKWSAPKELSILLDGEAKDRATADALRETLVQNKWYSTSSTGTDAQGGKRLPFGFKYRLRSLESTPPIEMAGNDETGGES